ncbi:hypothetical protein [Pantanalinema sp. GBBB05]
MWGTAFPEQQQGRLELTAALLDLEAKALNQLSVAEPYWLGD